MVLFLFPLSYSCSRTSWLSSVCVLGGWQCAVTHTTRICLLWGGWPVMKASYSRSVRTGISLELQRHSLCPSCPIRDALSRAGHWLKQVEEEGWTGHWTNAVGCNSEVLRITTTGLGEGEDRKAIIISEAIMRHSKGSNPSDKESYCICLFFLFSDEQCF